MTLRDDDFDSVRDDAVAALRALVRLPTVSHRDPADADPALFDALLDELARRFPLTHRHLEVVRVREHGLLLRWAGRADERPVVLMAHLDVVPVDEAAPWTHPAFEGVVDAGHLWGRGTLDDKSCVVAICSAVERLLARGFTPAQDVWLSFGCDEEVMGAAAVAAVDELERRGVRPWFVLDEGGAVAHGAFPGVTAPVAVIGVTEKGVMSLHLTAEGRGGHASTPARNGPTARLARAITRLERSPFPATTPAPTLELLRRLGPHLPAPLRPLAGRADRLGPLLTRLLRAAGPEAAAMTRTTVAVTTLEGSPALNVIASTARAGVNIRIMLGDTVASVTEHVERAVGSGIAVDVVEAHEPSPLSPYDADEAFALLESTVGEAFPDAVVSPYVMMAATDSRHFTRICERVYRFAPFRMTKEQREAIHSYDERIGLDDLADGVLWYQRLIERIG